MHLRSASFSTAGQLQAFTEAVSSLLHADADHATLFKDLLGYKNVIKKLGLQFGDRLVGLMLPPNDGDVELYTQCTQLYAKMAAVCQRVIREAPQELEHSPEVIACVTQACYLALLFQAERLRCAYCSYAQPPPELWFQIHQTYQYSLARGLANLPVHDESKLRHITHVYKRVLLFGICDPYRFPFRSVNGVFKALDDWAKLVHLRSGKPTADKCLFLINPNANRPAEPMLPKLSLGVDTLYLDTAPLVEVLNLDLNTHNEIGLNRVQQLEAELETREMLKTLIVSWGIHPPRQSERESCDCACEIVTSLSSVTTMLTLGNEQLSTTKLQLRKGMQLIDQSATGARIRLNRNDQIHVRVGELVAVRSQHSTQWAIGMVRWGQTDIDGEFYLGIYKFLDNATAVWVGADSELNRFPFKPTRGIWTMRKGAEERRPTLILNANIYKPNQRVSIDRGGQSSCFDIGKVILSTRYFVWCELTPPEPQPGLLHYLQKM